MTRIMKALNARMDVLKRNEEKGFTLIELLVVVIIIGILAAIAIPIYLGVQNSSKDASTQSDVTNAKIAVVAYETANPTATALPALTTAALGTYGFTQSTNTTTIAYSGTNTYPAFCIAGLSAATSTTFYVTDGVGVTKTKPSTC